MGEPVLRFLGTVLCWVLLWAPAAQAQLKLSDIFVDLHPKRMSAQIFAANTGDERLYLKVTVVEVLNPSLETEEVRDVADPRELGLLVSPQRLVVEPGEEKRIRMVALEKVNEDRFFKVTVAPVVGDIESEEMMGVKVLIAYAAWVFVRPEGGTPEISGTRNGRKLVVKNTGTTHAELTGGKQCTGAGRDTCDAIERFRVLAGREKTITLPRASEPVRFKILYADQTGEISF